MSDLITNYFQMAEEAHAKAIDYLRYPPGLLIYLFSTLHKSILQQRPHLVVSP